MQLPICCGAHADDSWRDRKAQLPFRRQAAVAGAGAGYQANPETLSGSPARIDRLRFAAVRSHSKAARAGDETAMLALVKIVGIAANPSFIVKRAD
jgi:hypothetical protein